MSPITIARLVPGSTAANTVNIPTVNIFLHKSPGKPSGDKRGITGVAFQVVKSGAVIQTGTTGADGKVVMQVPGGSATLRITASGATADYDVSIRSDAIEGGGHRRGPTAAIAHARISFRQWGTGRQRRRWRRHPDDAIRSRGARISS